MKYTEWELINEIIGGVTTLGLSNPQVIGGPVGAYLQEGPFDLPDDEEDDDDDEEDEDDDESEDDVDLLGKKPEGPSKGFPPDDSESMDGLPAPDEKMLGDKKGGGDEIDDTLAGIDPDLAGLGDDEMGIDPSVDKMGDIGDDELNGELPPDIADIADMGDEMGDEMGDDTAADMPCPECNADGGMDEGDPECETCGGEGFVTDDQMEMPEDPDAVDAGMEDEMGMAGGEPGVEGPAGEMMDIMSRMNAYAAKYMPAMMQAQMSAQMEPQMKPQMAAHSKKHMSKTASKKSRRFMNKDGCKKGCCKEDAGDFLNSLASAAKGDVHQKWSGTGLKEDALFAPDEPDEPQQQEEPQAGEVGFAPQAKVGNIGGGYQMSDFDDIPTLGESRNYNSWNEFLTKK